MLPDFFKVFYIIRHLKSVFLKKYITSPIEKAKNRVIVE